MTAITGREDREWQDRNGGEATSESREVPAEPAQASVTGSVSSETGPAATRRALGLRWWRELIYILIFYGVYTAIRDTQGSASVSRTHAFHNALHVIHLERDLWIFHEQAIQHAFLSWHWLLQILDVFYGSAHFAVTTIALIWVFNRMPARYALLRNTLAITTALALIGFAFYPLMPPRLLPETYHFVDTLKTVGGSWNFDSGTMQKLSNQYAAMPSLHFAWSSWCVCALWPGVRNRLGRVALLCYPLLTLFCIVVTANHYFLDAVGGLVVLSSGFVLALALRRVLEARRATPHRI